MLVFTSDGDELGRIKEMEDACFKLDVTGGIDFWLNEDAVESTEFGVARLNLPKDSFNRRLELSDTHSGMHIHTTPKVG